MSLVAQIGGKAIPLRDFQLRYTQTDIPEFDITIPTRDVIGMDLYLEDVAVYRDGTFIVGGIIKSPFVYPELLPSISNPLFTSLKCDTNLGRLALEASVLVHFQSTLLSVALATLLASTQFSNWVINDTTTLTDVNVTVDLRGKENLWSQIQELIATSRYATFVRYGGFSGGNHLLDVGYFRQQVNSPRAIWQSNILSPPRFAEASQEPIRFLYPVSGSSAEIPVDLDDALNLDPTLSSPTQDYQIIVGTGGIRNNRITKGCAIRKTISEIKTKNEDTPTQLELNQTALALYNGAVQEIEASENPISLTVQITSEDVPRINDAIWLESLVYETLYDLYTEQYEQVTSFHVSGWYRIVGITADLRERYELFNPYTEQYVGNAVYELELVAGDRRITKSETEIILDRTEPTNQFDNLSGIVGGGIISIAEVTVQHDTVAADCSYSGAGTGKSFNFPVPTAPAGASSVIVTVKDVNPSNYVYKVTTYPTLAGNYTICVQNDSSNDWDLSDSAEITVSMFFV